MAPRTARLVLCVPLVLALALAGGCGGSDDDASGGGATPTRTRPPAAPLPAPVGDGASGGGGAFGAPPVQTAAERVRIARHRAFVAAANAACGRVAAPPVAIGSALARDRRAALLAQERTQLVQLLAALRALHPPSQDRAHMRAYRRALRAQILLDGILARGLRATADADDLGVRMGEYQNDFNRTDRDALARRLGFGDCLADHAG